MRCVWSGECVVRFREGSNFIMIRLAIVDAFCPSFYGARAIADIVFGRAAPSGKLPVTIHPSNLVESVGLNELALAAGRGRTHRYFQDKPLWSFGFGLSYTEFELRWHAAPFIQQCESDGSSKFSANPQCEAEPVDPDIDGSLTLHIEQLADAGQDIVLPVQVSNVGDWDSAEVVQVYIVPVTVELQNPAPVPLRQLATFKRVALAAGEKVRFDHDCCLDGDENLQSFRVCCACGSIASICSSERTHSILLMHSATWLLRLASTALLSPTMA